MIPPVDFLLSKPTLPFDYAIDVYFVFFAFLAAALGRLTNNRLKRALPLFISLSSVFIIFGLTNSIIVIAYYTLSAILLYLITLAHRALPNKAQKGLVITSIIFFGTNLCAIKYTPELLHSALPSLDDTIPLLGILGISYATFKIFDFLIEMGRKRHPKSLTLFDVASFLLFFPTFAQGPIHRSVPFFKDLKADRNDPLPTLTIKDFERACWGIIKITFLAKVIWTLCPLNPAISELANETGSILLLLMSLYALYMFIYVEFSGISDIAIILGKILGFGVPENFNFPFVAKTPQEFWTRWHMSLTNWCQDHIFFNVYKTSFRTLKTSAKPVILFAPIFITFVIIGLWHGNTLNWLMYGLVHGIGVYLTTILKTPANDLLSPLRKSGKFYGLALDYTGRVLTFNFVSLSLIFALPAQQAMSFMDIFSRMGF